VPKLAWLRLFLTPIESHLFARPASYADKMTWLRKSFLRSIDHKSPTGGEYAFRVRRERDTAFTSWPRRARRPQPSGESGLSRS
jgi:hypothetical protein